MLEVSLRDVAISAKVCEGLNNAALGDEIADLGDDSGSCASLDGYIEGSFSLHE